MKFLFPILFVALILKSDPGQAQHLWEAGVFGGISNYEGGIAPDPVWKESHPAAGIFVKRNMSGYVSYSLGLNYGKLSGNDSNSASNVARGLNFKTDLYELSTQIELNFFNFGSKDIRGALQISPYLFTGLSLFYFDPKGFYNGQWYDLHDLATQGQGTVPGAPAQYSKTQLSIPF